MALLFMDSFDHYVTADVLEKWTAFPAAVGTAASVSIAVGGRRGTNSFRWITGTSTSATAAGYISRTVTPVNATAIIGFSFNMSGIPAGAVGCQIMAIRDGATTQINLRINSDGTLSVLRGPHSGGVVLGTTTAALTTSNYLELKVLIANSGGTVDLRVNGTSLAPFPLSGQDTQNTAVAQWTSVSFGQLDAVSNTLSGVNRTLDYDDIYVCDGTGSPPYNTFLGDCRVDPRYPTAEGTTIQCTPFSGTDNALMVNETAPDDDTTYNSATTVGQTDTFVTQDAPAVGATIYGLQHCISMKKSDAGICTVAPVIRHSGVDNAGTSMSPGTSYAYGLQIATEIAPGVAITESNFNAAEFGYTRLT